MNPKNPLQELLALLRQAGFAAQADDLEGHVRGLDSDDTEERAAAARAILERCHPRWLGDLYVPGTTHQQWWGLFGRCTAFAARRLERRTGARKRRGDANRG
ncbi:MAG TPA: hypothetical protein PLU22_14350 [Polyangiaceae bacterium]|nr:hypothetical protein [Polyangiaceae bacterium]